MWNRSVAIWSGGLLVLTLAMSLSGCTGSGDPLLAVENSDSVKAAQQQTCAKARPELLKGVEVIATTEAPFHEVKAAMVRRFGQAKADAAVIEVGDDVMVTLCALDVSRVSTTPQVGTAVMAVANGSSWWASTSLR